MDLYSLYATALLLLLPTVAWFIWRGWMANQRPHHTTCQFFRYSRKQRVVTLCAGIPLIAFVAIVPYRWSPITDIVDVAILLALVIGCSSLLFEANNRLVVTSSEGIASRAWRHGSKIAWSDIRRVTFYDTFGGFFLVQHAAGRLYIPVQVERPLELLRDLEDHVPEAAIAPAKKGIAICRAHLG